MNLLSLHYLGNIRYFTKLCFTECVIDIHEHYVKQSYRNRCEILTANGRVPLVANVINPGNFSRTAIRDIRLDHSKRWSRIHWQSVVSAYANSPYFDFYAERFEPFFSQKFGFLLDLNAGLLGTVLDILGIERKPRFSERYVEGDGFSDYRTSISPKARLKRSDPHFQAEPYWQVFSDRFPFEKDLSIIDLIMCEGPRAREILEKSYIP